MSQRTNLRQYEVQGAAQAGAEVRVNGVVATRQGDYFRFEGTASGTAAQWLDPTVTLNGATLISGRKKYVPPQTEAMLHDVAGNRIQDGRWEMRWDNENRLADVWTLPAAVTAGVPNQRLRYTYDADGRLIERRRFSWVSGEWSLAETTRYLNDGLQCVAEFNGSNGLLRRQVWGLDLDGSRGGLGGIGGLLWIVSQANGTHYAAPDGSGNVVALFGTSGTETARYEYGPFGELLRMSGTAIAAENPWRFSSKRQDPTTDWVHYEFRVYDPSSGRWLSRDPIGEAGGENLYGFVGNDPVNRVDLFGLQETGGGVVALQLMPPPVLPRQLPAGSTPCSASVPRISVPLPQCNPIADVIWGKPVQAPQPCPPRHIIGAPTPGPKIPVPRGLSSAEAYRYNSFLMAFGSSGLCDSPIGFRLAQINMQLINHAAAIPSQAQVDGVLRFGGAVLDRIGRCGRNLPRFQCTRSSSCLLEEATKWSPHPGFQMPAADKGRFLGDVGNSAFALSDDAAAAFGVPSGTSIPWREGIPDFGAHAVHGPSGIPSTFNVPGLTGDHAADRTLMLQQMAAQCGMSQRAVKQWLSVNNVRLHHSGGAQQLRGGN